MKTTIRQRHKILKSSGLALVVLAWVFIASARAETIYVQTVFQDDFNWADIDSPTPDIGDNYQNWLNNANNNHEIITTAGPDGAITEVLKIDKVAGQSTGLRGNFIDYDPSNFKDMVVSIDYKPITGKVDGTNDPFGSFSTYTEAFGVDDDVKVGQQGLWANAYQDFGDPLPGFHLYARGPGGLNDFLDGGGRGELYTNDVDGVYTPDGTWYNFTAVLSMPDESGNYSYDLEFTPYNPDGTLDTAATATYSTTGTFGELAYFGDVHIIQTVLNKSAEYYLDNFKVTMIPEPSTALLLMLGGIGLLKRR